VTKLILTLLASSGLALVINRGSILGFVRVALMRRADAGSKFADKLLELMSCPMCAGFWSGVAVMAVVAMDGPIVTENKIVDCILMGFASSLVASIASRTTE
jgi:hypothetical protein